MLNKSQLKSLAPCKKRWRIYERFVVPVITRLNEVATQNPFAVQALEDPQLVRPLIELLDRLTAAAVARDLYELREYLERKRHRWRPPPQISEINKLRRTYDAIISDDKPEQADRIYDRYFKWLIIPELIVDTETRRPGIDVFFEYHATTRVLLERVSEQFRSSMALAVQRLAGDRETISNVFFDDAGITALVRITPSGGDTHKRGRAVLFFSLQVAGANEGLHKLVYKPSDIEMDYRFCGRTDAYNPYGDDAPPQSLAELINALRLQAGLNPNVPELPTYRILPRHPGSGLEVNDNQLPVGNSYGYIEFLRHAPEAGIDGLPAGPVSDADFAASDWLTTTEQSDVFYRTWGAWLAIARVFSWSDLHLENIIAHDKLPVPIDLEVSFSGPITSLPGTAAVSDKSAPGGAGGENDADKQETGGLTGWLIKQQAIGIQLDGTSRMYLDSVDSIRSVPASNRVVELHGSGWRRVLPREQTARIGAAMQHTLPLIANNQPEFTTWIDAMGDCMARAVPVPSAGYMRALGIITASAHSTRNPEGQANTPDRPAWHRVDAFLHPPAKLALGAGNAAHPADQLHTDQHDYDDLSHHDIPAYYHRLESRALYNARGRVVSATYFDRATIEDVRQQLNDLNDARIIEMRDEAVLAIAGLANTEDKLSALQLLLNLDA